MNFSVARARPSAGRSPAAAFTVAVAMVVVSMVVFAGVATAAPSDPILVFTGNVSLSPGTTYAGVGVAADRPISSTGTLPGSLSGNACVLLSLNQASFSGPQVATLTNYLAAGGRVVMVGENDNYANNDAFRGLATSLGSSMQIENNAFDPGFRDTLYIDADPLTRDVTAVNYAYTATVSFNSPARSLVRRSDGSATMMAAEAIGAGELIAVGDANAFTTPSGGAGLLVANMCGSRRTTTSDVECTPASALVGDTVTCAATVTDSEIGGTADTPTGDVGFTHSGAGAGTFDGDGACTLAGTGTLGEASCTVTYTATTAGAQTLTGAYEGTTRSYGSSGSDAHAATLPAPPAPTDGHGTAPYGQPQTFQVTIPAGGSVTLLANGQPATSVTFAGEGVYALDASAGVIRFTPRAGFSGTARSVTFRVTDSYGQSADASFGATVSPPPTATVPPTPDDAPARAVCVSRRVVNVHFRIPSGTKVRSVRAWIARKAVRRLSPTTRRLRVDLRGMGPRSVHVVIVIKVAGAKRIRDVRVYRTCPSRRPT